MRIMTAGSCFAQHITTRLRDRGYGIIDTEPAPYGLRGAAAKRFGYQLFSARYGNIYTVRHLNQLMRECLGKISPADGIWQKKGRFYDAMRPSVEPQGLESAAEVQSHHRDHLKRVLWAFQSADVFVFTFGLTEAWIHSESGTVYPTAPGTIAGEFEADRYSFKNFTFLEIFSDFVKFRRIFKKIRPEIKFLLTVSPVPLTATASGEHVLVAATHSKAILRSVAGQLAAELDDVDYFPSYEIIATPYTGRVFYDSNLRSVSSEGVDTVMKIFFHHHGQAEDQLQTIISPQKPGIQQEREEDAVCEDILLQRFAW